MSLINDALQRAQQVQQSQSPFRSHPQFRPVERPPVKRRRFLWPSIFVGVVAVVVLGVFVMFQQLHPEPPVLPALERSVASAGSPAPAPAVAPVQAPVPEPAPVVEPAPLPVVTTEVVQPDLVVQAKTPELAVTNAVVEMEPPQPHVPLPRLQGILFGPRPSAIVDGRTVFVNGQVAGYRVTAITAESVTLVVGTQTNVVRMYGAND